MKDVARAIHFYTQQLGFTLERKHLPAFAQVSLGDFRLMLSGPGASGSRPLPDGQSQEPGGWNRIMLEVPDLGAAIERLKKSGVRFRNEIEAGRAAGRSRCWTPTATRWSCSSRRVR